MRVPPGTRRPAPAAGDVWITLTAAVTAALEPWAISAQLRSPSHSAAAHLCADSLWHFAPRFTVPVHPSCATTRFRTASRGTSIAEPEVMQTSRSLTLVAAALASLAFAGCVV